MLCASPIVHTLLERAASGMCCDMGRNPRPAPIPQPYHRTYIEPGVVAVLFTEGTTAQEAEQFVNNLGISFKFAPTGSPLNGVISVPVGFRDPMGGATQYLLHRDVGRQDRGEGAVLTPSPISLLLTFVSSSSPLTLILLCDAGSCTIRGFGVRRVFMVMELNWRHFPGAKGEGTQSCLAGLFDDASAMRRLTRIVTDAPPSAGQGGG